MRGGVKALEDSVKISGFFDVLPKACCLFNGYLHTVPIWGHTDQPVQFPPPWNKSCFSFSFITQIQLQSL